MGYRKHKKVWTQNERITAPVIIHLEEEVLHRGEQHYQITCVLLEYEKIIWEVFTSQGNFSLDSKYK